MRRSTRVLAAGAAGLALTWLLRSRRRWEFENKVVLITGGSKGLGLLMARQLADEGARLALLARDAGELERAAAELRAAGVSVLTLPCDVGDKAQVEAAVDAVLARYGRLDVLINNAGIIQVGPVEHMGVDDFEAAMRVHFWGPLYAILASLPQMKRQREGRIVNIASIGGKIAVPHLVPYSASKFALVGLSDGMRAELAREGIRVSTVCPWLTRTGSYSNVTLKGQHRRELVWFALGDSLPLASVGAEGTARRILEACRRGEPRVVLAPQGKAAVLADALFPQLSAAAMATANRFLPRPVPGGEAASKGWESPSPWVPSPLTGLSDRAAARNNERPVPGAEEDGD